MAAEGVMPGGSTAVGFGVFAGIKLVGYTGFANALQWGYPGSRHGVLKIGAARTATGITAGLAYGALWIGLLEKALAHRMNEMAMLSIYYFLLLLPLRFTEWGFTIWLFSDRELRNRTKILKWIVLGMVCSYLLDAAGLFGAFVVPGGFWIC